MHNIQIIIVIHIISVHPTIQTNPSIKIFKDLKLIQFKNIQIDLFLLENQLFFSKDHPIKKLIKPQINNIITLYQFSICINIEQQMNRIKVGNLFQKIQTSLANKINLITILLAIHQLNSKSTSDETERQQQVIVDQINRQYLNLLLGKISKLVEYKGLFSFMDNLKRQDSLIILNQEKFD
ncbi:unnamed protein product [Paramecium octaurelia]|uniref:Uncharacterized protein n=1 Tax=Paramecium octaurelia TaxID=43137 RepID=A0A8S1S8U1_PAROT|nr:unnamed protein product [Paramecium octaurelia]